MLHRPLHTVRAFVILAIAAVVLAACGEGGESSPVGEFANDWSGNAIEIVALKDPDIDGVTCHLAHFDRSLIDRLWKGNWFEDPSNASIACRQTGPIRIRDIPRSGRSEEIFSQRQSLVFKSLGVRRMYDGANDSLVYVIYSRRPVEGSAKMSMSTIALYGEDVVWENKRAAAAE
jgi:CreA protein